tara:strand:- start:224 stop:508 length:285 start_codon:yes stop_codon:yes gene_type:complete
MEFHSLYLPNFWGSALVNGDYSGLTDEDELELNTFIEYWEDDLDFSCVDVPSDDNGYIESSFMKYHDAEITGVLACDCWEYKILIKPNSPLLTS